MNFGVLPLRGYMWKTSLTVTHVLIFPPKSQSTWWRIVSNRANIGPLDLFFCSLFRGRYTGPVGSIFVDLPPRILRASFLKKKKRIKSAFRQFSMQIINLDFFWQYRTPVVMCRFNVDFSFPCRTGGSSTVIAWCQYSIFHCTLATLTHDVDGSLQLPSCFDPAVFALDTKTIFFFKWWKKHRTCSRCSIRRVESLMLEIMTPSQVGRLRKYCTRNICRAREFLLSITWLRQGVELIGCRLSWLCPLFDQP